MKVTLDPAQIVLDGVAIETLETTDGVTVITIGLLVAVGGVAHGKLLVIDTV